MDLIYQIIPNTFKQESKIYTELRIVKGSIINPALNITTLHE